MCSFAEDTTFCACNMDLKSLIKRLEHHSFLAIEWLGNNNVELNQDKCHFLVSACKNENVWLNIGKEINWRSDKQKLLGLDIDENLNLNKHYLLCVEKQAISYGF